MALSKVRATRNSHQGRTRDGQGISKILSKSFKIPPKSLLKPTFKKRRVQNAFQNRLLRHLGRFLMNFWKGRAPQSPPKSNQNRKIRHKNRCYKITCFSTPFFLDFSWLWRPKTTPKSKFFRYFFENIDFVKIVVFPKENC